MFSRKQYDEKKHPFKGKGKRSPKPYKKERVVDVLKEIERDIYVKMENENG